ncbi:helix-turn-helix domain-containing protein [Uliginosibacterium aquaticum]|uniref:ArsR family transcriptional regulator n=1 Tax=Uliginosibacterium aquaticum TaxID=2731212 RepID=A0ABX2IEV3_9RHOO|nr:hypothetical protein [Uliginosibacterium aquaticum]NSL55219.1 hypothetical protein [Uliginosibacterium aquaticum]
MDRLVFAKTSAGLDEIQQRQMRLHPRVRSLLILVDGKQPVSELRGKFAVDPVILQEHLELLQEAGLIHPVVESVEPTPHTGPASNLPEVVELPAQGEASWMSEMQSPLPSDESSRLMALYRIYTETISASFAAKSAPYLKELDKAARIGDYIALGNKIITALNKSARVNLAVEFKRKVKPLLR